MVEYQFQLDYVFGSLSDATRRDILRRVSKAELTVGEIASSYEMSFAAVSKHLKILERAKLVIKRRNGKKQMVSIAPGALSEARDYLDWYKEVLEDRYDALDSYLNSN